MRPQHITFTMAAADPNGLITATTPAGAGAITLNGALESGGTGTMDVPRHVSVTSDGDDSGVTFTVVGTDRFGDALTEVITGPNTTTVNGSSNFKTVTSVTISGAGTGSIEVGSADEADTQLIVTNWRGGAVTYGVDLAASASMTTEVKYTLDDVFNTSFTQETANYISDLGTSNGDYDGASTGPITGIRMEVTAFSSGTAYFHVIQSDT